MKKLFFMLIAACMLASCGSQAIIGQDGKPLSTEESAKVISRTINSRLDNRDYRILVSEMTPMGWGTRQLRDEWALEIHGDSIGSILPYIGRGYNIPYGSGMGLHFITRIDSYHEEEPKPDMREITIRCHTDEDSYQYVVEVYDNGTAYISVYSRHRDMVRYSGKVDLHELYSRK